MLNSERSITAIAIVGLALLMAGTYLLERHTRSHHDQDVERLLTTVLSTSHQSLHQWKEESYLKAKIWAAMPSVVESTEELLALPPSGETERRTKLLTKLRDTLSFIRNSDRYEGFFIIDADYISIASMRDENVGTRNLLATRPSIINRVLQGETLISHPLTSDVYLRQSSVEQITQFVATPMIVEGKVIAAFALRINPEITFANILRQGRPGQSGETYAFNKTGVLISTPRFQSDSTTRLDKGHPFWNQDSGGDAPQAPVALNHYHNYLGDQVIGTWFWDAEMGLGISAEISREEISKQLTSSLMPIRLASALSAALILSIVFLSLRYRAALKRRNILFKTTFEQATVGIAHLDLDGRFIRINSQFCKILGATEIQVREMPFNPCGDDGSQLMESFADLLADQKEQIAIEKSLQKNNGSDVWVYLTTTLVRKPNREPHYFMVVMEDINYRKQATEELIKSQQYMKEAERIAGIGYWILELPDRNLIWSEQTHQIFHLGSKNTQHTLEEMLKRIHPDDRDNVEQRIENALQGNEVRAVEFRVIAENERFQRVRSEIKINRDEQGKLKNLLGTVQDITERYDAQQRMRQSAKVFDGATEGIIIADMTPAIVAVNPAFTEITGYQEHEVLGRNPNILSSGRQDNAFYKTMWDSLVRDGRWQGEISNRRKNGEIYPEWMTISAVRNEQGNITHYVATFSDISRIKESEDKLAFLAHHDPLTRLPNRLMLESHLNHCLQISDQQQHPFSVLFLDLDQFKYINDSYGHPCGDKVLCQVAERLVDCLNENCLLSRHGGDEFVIVVQDANTEKVEKLATALLDTMNEPFYINDLSFDISGSIGISFYPQHGETPATLIKNADAAMFEAKKQGRNRYVHYQESMTLDALKEMELLSHLRRAIELNELEVYYQPQISFNTGRISGAEALLRWKHSKLGMISPDQFIPLAEESGLIIPIGHWVLQQACQQVKQWHQYTSARFPVSVNLSPRQFGDRNLLETIENCLEENELDSSYLELELTEGALIEDPESTLVLLKRLKLMGIAIAVDDFGTGYSSLSYLSRFPIDRVKIDKEFISRLITDTENTLITRSIISMSHFLHCQVIAEGVENETQLSYLLQHNCDHFQGFFYSPPVPANDFKELLDSNRHHPLKEISDHLDNRRTLLILDDEAPVLSALKRALRKENYRVITAQDPYEALEILAGYHVGVVITDQRMPTMTGSEFLIRVRQLYPDTVRIVLSGHAEIDAITSAVNEGDIYRFLLKPWKDDELRKHIDEAFLAYENKQHQNLFLGNIQQLIDEYENHLIPGQVTGIQELDDQHSGMIEICQQMAKLFSSEVTVFKLRKLFDQLTDLALENFKLEEKLMQEYDYPARDQHITEHDLFIEQIKRLQHMPEQHENSRMVFLMVYIGIWIKHHERSSDKYLIEFLKQRKSKEIHHQSKAH
ncbi:MAG: EAL domain-containing protein [Motiliproteus sp.]|nr:EAL domain-containing protein [Motiliproteus sp.]MCW9051573.1 EAL domain-containing protein [Motiliproteus sp.]